MRQKLYVNFHNRICHFFLKQNRYKMKTYLLVLMILCIIWTTNIYKNKLINMHTTFNPRFNTECIRQFHFCNCLLLKELNACSLITARFETFKKLALLLLLPENVCVLSVHQVVYKFFKIMSAGIFFFFPCHIIFRQDQFY